MTVRDMVRSWLLEYGYEHRMPRVIKALQMQDGVSSAANGTCMVPRMLACTLELILQEEQYSSFGVAVHLTNSLFDTAADLLSFKAFAKILTGIKILHLFHMLRNGQRLVLPTLNRYFPRSGFQHNRGDEKLMRKLGSAQLKFRKFMLSLLSNDVLQKRYLKEEFDDEYGADFIRKLQQLTHDFVGQIEAALPPSMIDKFLEAGVDSEFAQQMGQAGGLSVDILLDSLHGKKRLSEDDVLDIVEMLSQKGANKKAHYHLDLDSLEIDDSGISSSGRTKLPSGKRSSQQNGPRSVLSQRSVEENCKVPITKKPSVKKLEVPPPKKKPRLASPSGSPKENSVLSKTRTPKGKSQSENSTGGSNDEKKSPKTQKPSKSEAISLQEPKRRPATSPKQDMKRIVSVKKASPTKSQVSRRSPKKYASSSESDDPKKLTRSLVAKKFKQQETCHGTEQTMTPPKKSMPANITKTSGKGRPASSTEDTSDGSQESQDAERRTRRKADKTECSQGELGSRRSDGMSPTRSASKQPHVSVLAESSPSRDLPGHLERRVSPRLTRTPSRFLDHEVSSQLTRSSPRTTSSPLHVAVLRATPRRHGNEHVDVAGEGVCGTPRSPRRKGSSSDTPLITIHVDDEVSLNVSMDSDDIVLFNDEDERGPQSSSEDEWASCHEEIPPGNRMTQRSSSPETISISSSNSSDKDGEIEQFGDSGSKDEDEVIPSSNVTSFQSSFIPSSSFYGKSSQGGADSLLLPPFPPLQQHLLDPTVRPCVIKLFRNQALNSDGQYGRADVYD